MDSGKYEFKSRNPGKRGVLLKEHNFTFAEDATKGKHYRTAKEILRNMQTERKFDLIQSIKSHSSTTLLILKGAVVAAIFIGCAYIIIKFWTL